MFDKPTEKIL